MKLTYKYGLLAPTDNAKLADDQIYLAHKEYNNLIKAYRDRLDAFWEEEKRHEELAPTLGARDKALKAFEDAGKDIGQMWADKPTGSADSAPVKAWEKERKAAEKYRENVLLPALRKASAAHKAARKKLMQDHPEHAFTRAVKALDKVFVATCKRLYQESELFWCSFNLVRRFAEQAAQKTQGPPKFRSYKGEGTIGVQLMTNATEATLATHTFLQVDPVDPAAWDKATPRGQRRRLSRTTMRMRVGTVPGTRTPIWVTWPMIMHRPLPEGTRVTNAAVHRVKHANRDHWSVTLSLTVPDVQQADCDGPRVAIDLGWRQRKQPDGTTALRVAYWYDSDGREGEYLLPAEIYDKVAHADGIQSVRDKLMDQLRDALRRDLKDRSKMSEDLRKCIKALHQWRSFRTFARLWYKHKDEVLPYLSDDPLLADHPYVGKYDSYLERWFHRDKHLWQYEEGTRRRAIALRREDVKIWAASIAEQYNVVVVEDMNMEGLVRKKKGAEDQSDAEAKAKKTAARNRTRSAVGEVRSTLQNACRQRGVMFIKAPTPYTTMDCHDCGTRQEVGKELVHECVNPDCGVGQWDQDANAARNLLGSAPGMIEQARGEKPEVKKAKYHRRHKGSGPRPGSMAAPPPAA